MSFLDKITASLPLGKREEKQEYFFAINIGVKKLTAALWGIEGRELKVLDIASGKYSSNDEIVTVTDRLLDQVLGMREIEPQKILFGVPNSWLIDENLKDEYLKILRVLVKELELTPMAYVATSNSLIHFLEKQEGVPTTAILVGFEKLHLAVTVVRAGKLDGVKIVERGETSGVDIEKALLSFADIETLPSKILIYGEQAQELKSKLLSFSWMSKLSFLHFPKIEVLGDEIEIKSVCLAGGSELNTNILYTDNPVKKQTEKAVVIDEEVTEKKDLEDQKTSESGDNFGFIVGDISTKIKQDEEVSDEFLNTEKSVEYGKDLAYEEQESVVMEDFAPDPSAPQPTTERKAKMKIDFKKFLPKSLPGLAIPVGIIGIIILLLGALIFFLKADVKIFVEPKITEKDAQVVADPKQKTVDEAAKVIPGQIVETEISGSAKESATGKKQVGDPAKGTVVIINNTAQGQNFSAGIVLNSSGGMKFKLDNTASVSATPLDADSKSKVTVTVTAVDIGADGNISSETNLTIGNFPTSQFVGKAQGNFSGGNSKDVTVVSSDDQQKLLAKLTSDLRQQSQQKLQEKYPDKKILQEAMSEQITSKKYSKNVNDQANEFSLNLTITYKGTTFDDADLRTIVGKLVNTEVPPGFSLDIAGTETQADVSKLEKDGRLVFLARFKAKFLPNINTDKIKGQIAFKTPAEAISLIKGMDNILDAEIKISPNLPELLQRLPLFAKNITVEVGLK